MKILTVGTGNIGSIIARDLAENMTWAEMVIADKNQHRAEKVAAKLPRRQAQLSSPTVE
jgi:saccharopine dehydrogenase-like NADP-dependent oxidoreductase